MPLRRRDESPAPTPLEQSPERRGLHDGGGSPSPESLAIAHSRTAYSTAFINNLRLTQYSIERNASQNSFGFSNIIMCPVSGIVTYVCAACLTQVGTSQPEADFSPASNHTGIFLSSKPRTSVRNAGSAVSFTTACAMDCTAAAD